MTIPDRIGNHVELGLAKLPSAFSESALLRSVASALLAEVQELEEAAQEMLKGMLFDYSGGAQLRQITGIFGTLRGQFSDEVLRRWFVAQLRHNRSSGEPDRLIQIVRALTRSARILARPVGNVGISLEYDVAAFSDTTFRARMFAMLLRATSSGAELGPIVEVPPGAFGWDADNDAGDWNYADWAEAI